MHHNNLNLDGFGYAVRTLSKQGLNIVNRCTHTGCLIFSQPTSDKYWWCEEKNKTRDTKRKLRVVNICTATSGITVLLLLVSPILYKFVK